MAMTSEATTMSKPSWRGKPLAEPAETDDDVAQRAIVHVDHPLPGDAPHVESQLIAVVDVIVDQRGQQVVREPDGAEIPGEVQIDVLHRDDLSETAARRAALHAEHRSEARLAQADDRLLADLVQGIAQSDRGRGLAFAGGRRAQRRHQNQLAVGLVLQAVDVIEGDLGLVVPVVLNAGRRDAEPGGDLGDWLQGCALGDLYVGTHVYSQYDGG